MMHGGADVNERAVFIAALFVDDDDQLIEDWSASSVDEEALLFVCSS